MKNRLVVACRVPPDVAARARAEFDAVVAEGADMTMDQALAQLAEHRADALFLTSMHKLTAAAVAALPESVRIVATCSVGYDHIDVAAARARGLVVTNTPDVLTDCTADMAMLLMLGACRRAHEYQAIIEAGWRQSFGQSEMLGLRVSGRALGLVGMGRIGRAVARRAQGFGMRVLYHNRTRLPEASEEGAEYVASLPALLARAQILSLHAPGGAATEKLMDAAAFAAMPAGAVFVNTSRGSLVDEDALLAALDSGHLFAAGLDVFRNEPAFDLRLRDHKRVFAMPHMGSATIETRNAMGFRALDNIAALCAGRAPADPLWT